MTDAKTVFIVDDDEAIRDSLEILLMSRGFDVRAFGSARAFLDAFDTAWRGCLLLDIRMPGMDGRELQHELLERDCRLPIIFITGHGNVEMAVDAMKKGAADFIQKPLDPEALVTCVLRNLESRRTGPAPADPELVQRHSRLTAREKEVMEGVVKGLLNKVVAHRLGISPRTVELHRARVMENMAARSLPDLTRMGLGLGLVPE